MTVDKRRMSDIAKGMALGISRIGYEDEGIRLMVYHGMPFNYHSELQLSRADAEWLVAELMKYLQCDESGTLQ